jgi:hypothetical protein
MFCDAWHTVFTDIVWQCTFRDAMLNDATYCDVYIVVFYIS